MNIFDDKYLTKRKDITVEFFYKNVSEKFLLKLLSSGKGLHRKIVNQNLHRPGLALAGFVDLFTYDRIQVFGNTEKRFLEQLSREKD